MLKKLFIQNYALIDELNTSWSKDFTVITGETGSGKSILLGALGLIIGNRADTSVLRSSDKKCVVEAEFDLKGFNLKAFFKDHDLDYEQLTVLRREINKSGKSRAFVNDTPVNLAQLKQLGDVLVDIHSQHETLHLRDNQFQLEVLDDFAGLGKELGEYRVKFDRWKSVVLSIRNIEHEIREDQQKREFREFQLNEIQEANLKVNEQAEIEEELELLSSAEEIKAALVSSGEALQLGDPNVVAMMQQCLQQLEPVREKTKELSELYDRLKSAAIEVKDVAQELDRSGEQLEFNPDRVVILQDRIDLIYQLQQKHGVSSNEALLEIAAEFERQLSGHLDRETELNELRSEEQRLSEDIIKQAKTISEKRHQSADKLEAHLNEVLGKLEMKSAEISVQIDSLETPAERGMDRVSFLMKANKGHDFLPLEKSASGGELSRVMLALKSVHSGRQAMPTLILDEIDSGVSGKVANAMAALLHDMGLNRQLICITHLPQIAARGQAHFRVSKKEHQDKTVTQMELLDRDGRLYEIAGMLSGFDTTDAAIENARTLMHLN